MSLRILVTGFYLMLSFTGIAQNLIGYHTGEIKKYMLTRQNDFSLDNTTINRSYRYLKYVDRLGTRTALYFLSDADICTWYKTIYDNSLLNQVSGELDKSYRKLADTLWLEQIDGHYFQKILKRQDWFFSVTTKPVQAGMIKKQ